jgi:dTDP-4-dehydrorhamnose 3,5-epimerase-like enzyme
MGVRIIELPKIQDPRGNLTFLQSMDQVPFKVKRVFWTYDVPGGQVRGGHAYRSNTELIIALSGSFDVVLFDGKTQQVKSLNRSYQGLLVPPHTWRHLENFSTNAIALTLASKEYDESDYIRDFDMFRIELNES